MRLVITSDTHGYHHDLKVPDGDVFIHCGDCTDDIGRRSLREFLQWMHALPHRHKLFVAGNHDGAFEKWPALAYQMVKEIAPDVTYLQDGGVLIDGLLFWGSPYTPTFLNWFHMRDRGATIKRHWDMIPAHTSVLITHGPPHGYLDLSKNINFATLEMYKDHLGCEELTKAVERVQPMVHCFGHIHGSGGGHAKLGMTTLINASLLDEAYIPTNQPQIYYLHEKNTNTKSVKETGQGQR